MQGSEPKKTIKIVIIGDLGVGKTALLSNYLKREISGQDKFMKEASIDNREVLL